MDGPPAQDAVLQFEKLIAAIDDLRRRVDLLEQRSVAAVPSGGLLQSSSTHQPLPEVSSGLLAQLGRLLLGIAGAYLLRAITESGIIPQLTGTLAGLLYASAWLIASVRTAASDRVSLALAGLTASAIAAPLLWEATVRFHTISPSGAAAVLALFIALGQIVAWKRDHDAIAAITALAGSVTAVALIMTTLDPVPFTIALIAAAAVVEWGAIRNHGLAWRWIIALGADFCAFLLVYLVTRPQGLPEGYAPVPPTAVIAVQIALVVVYLMSTATRTLALRLRISWFEILQSASLMVFAIASNLRAARGVGGAMILAAGGFCYVAAFRSSKYRLRQNFHAYSTFGVILLITGSFLLLPVLGNVALWSVLTLGAIWLGERQNKTTLRIHGVIFLLAAAAASFKLNIAWPPALAAALAYGLMLWIGSSQGQDLMQRIPAALVATVLVWSVYSVGTAGFMRTHVDSSLAATLRTILISVIAIALSALGRRWNRAELIWVLYLWMIYGAGKLFAEDFQQGRSSTLFLSLVVYGGTLIALPRLLRRTGRSGLIYP